MKSPIQCIEFFHLAFLDQFSRKVDKNCFALKGGCNLRFFLKSIRFSQDIDLDIQTIRKETLQKQVNQILGAKPFQMILRTHGVEIARVSDLKQTQTTQRWKIQLAQTGSSLPIPTKIEFSRRGMQEDHILFEPIDPLVIQPYSLSPIHVNHYSATAAFQQKIDALCFRSETQARDVFDLYHLLSLGSSPPFLRENKAEAQAAALSIDFDQFKDQVLAFLSPEYRAQYQDPPLWNQMVLTVVQALEEAS